jgi:hypothetical protein
MFLFFIFFKYHLFQLRESLLLAEMEREGGVSQHISPMASASDVSA